VGFLFAFSVSDLNPVHDTEAAFYHGLQSFSQWVSTEITGALASMFHNIVGIVISAMVHTTPQFADTKFNPVQPSLFNPVWHTMVTMGVACAGIIMAIGITAAVIKGETGLLVKQVGLGLLGILLMASPIVPDIVQALFNVIDIFSKYILNSAVQGAIHQASHAAHARQSLATQIQQSLGYLTGGSGMLIIIMLIVGCLAALVVWFELIARLAIAYLMMALVPLALAGLFFKGTQSWIKKAVEGIVGVAFSQIIIAVVLALGFSAALSAGATDSETSAALFLVFMMIATLGLPVALRVAPLAVDAAIMGTEVSGMARHHAAKVGKAAVSKGAGALGGGAGAGGAAGGAGAGGAGGAGLRAAQSGLRSGPGGGSSGGASSRAGLIGDVQMGMGNHPGSTGPSLNNSKKSQGSTERKDNVVKPIDKNVKPPPTPPTPPQPPRKPPPSPRQPPPGSTPGPTKPPRS